MKSALMKLWAALRRQSADREIENELQFHFDMEVAKQMEHGLSRTEAMRAARLKAGSVDGAMEEMRDTSGMPLFEETLRNLRLAWQSLARQRGFTFVAGMALAAAVGTNTLVVTLAEGVLLKPLPYREPERLIRIFDSQERNPKWPISPWNYLDYRENTRTLESIGIYTGGDLQLTSEASAELVPALQVSADFFPTLGAKVARGRNFSERECLESAKVLILSHSMWKSRFQGDPGIVGRTVRVNREPWSVIGVLPPEFQHPGGTYRSPLHGDTVGFYYPVNLKLTENMRGWHFVNAVARLRPGATLAQVDAELNSLAAERSRKFPRTGNWGARTTTLASEIVGRSNETVGLLLGAAGVVLLIAFANVAGLWIARGLARRREWAIRLALGASRGQLARQAVAEGMVLGVAGGAAGLALAAASVPALIAAAPADFPRLHEVHLSWFGAAFSLISATLIAIASSVLPAFSQSGRVAAPTLHEESVNASHGRRAARVRWFLVAGEVALASVLCLSAGLLVRSYRVLGERPAGFDASGVVTFSIDLPRAVYQKPEQRVPFYDELTRRMNAIPGIKSTGLATNLPWTGYDENSSFAIVGKDTGDYHSGQGRYQAATPGYFQSMAIPLKEGRHIGPRDGEKTPPVVVVNEALVRKYLNDRNAVGTKLRLWGKEREVIGVVADICDWPADKEAESAYWYPLQQETFSSVFVTLKTNGDTANAVSAARAVLRELDAELPMANVRTMDSIGEAALGERRFAMWLLEGGAMLALLLAGFGAYGLMAYSVERRKKEFGIRLALGASRQGMMWLVAREGALMALMGLAVALVLTPIVSKALSSWLFGIGRYDPLAVLGAATAIAGAALIACAVPAWRAAGSEPLRVLREE